MHSHILGENMKTFFKSILNILLLITVLQCYQITSSIRIYNLNNSEKIEIDFKYAIERQGEVSYIAEDGESFEGEFLFQGTTKQIKYFRDKFMGNEELFLSDKKAKESFAALYGFSKKSNAQPVGTMVLVGDFGTVIDLVFYTFSFDKGTASGVGKDNKGNVYRVYTNNYYS